MSNNTNPQALYKRLLHLAGQHSQAEKTSYKHWQQCPNCFSFTGDNCETGQRLSKASNDAFKAWDELDTRLFFNDELRAMGQDRFE